MRRTGMNKLAPLAAALLVLTAACGSADSDGSNAAAGAADPTGDAAGGVTIDDLDGMTFVADETDQLDSPKATLAAGSKISIQFQAGDLSATAGCNGLGSEADIVDGVLEVDGLVGTEMACEDDVMAQERWLTTFLTAGPDVALDGETLTLTSGDETLVLTGAAVDPTPGGDDDGVTSTG